MRELMPGILRHLSNSATDLTEVAGPPPNVWLGTSVEDQAAADNRIPPLAETPASVRFLSCEPLLGPIDDLDLTAIGWVIVGGVRKKSNGRKLHGQTWDEMPDVRHPSFSAM